MYKLFAKEISKPPLSLRTVAAVVALASRLYAVVIMVVLPAPAVIELSIIARFSGLAVQHGCSTL